MPAVSRQQYRWMQAVANSSVKAPGLSPEQAKEYISKNKGKLSPHNLPRISKMMKNKG